MVATPVKVVFNYFLSVALGQMSGVRAFLPTFVVSILALIMPDWVDLAHNMKWVKHPATATISGVLAVGEIIMSEIPAIDNIFHIVMTAIHPVMGFVSACVEISQSWVTGRPKLISTQVNALAPNLGDPTAYTQGPLAVFGGSQALILHALKLLVRLAGCGCIGPVIGAIETFGSLILVPLAAVWKATSELGTLLLVVFYVFKKYFLDGKEVIEGLLDGDPQKQARIVNYFRRKHSLLSIYYLETADGLPRGPRVAIVLTNWFVQLALVSSFMTTRLSSVVYQVLAAILAAWLFLPVVRFIIRNTHARDRVDGWVLRWRDIVLGPYTTGIAAVLCAAALIWTILISRDWHKGSGGLLVVSFLTSVAIGMALELGRLLLNHVCCKCCPCHDDEAISDAPAGQRTEGAVVAQPAAQA